MKNKYKKLLSCVLAAEILFTTSGCSNRSFPDLSAKTYTVEEGDTLYDISKRIYGVDTYWDDIADYNGIKDPNSIKPGDIIKLPKIENFCYYTIKEDDNLWDICFKKYGTNDLKVVEALANYNKIKDINLIKVGDTIIIPELKTLEELFMNSSSPSFKLK